MAWRLCASQSDAKAHIGGSQQLHDNAQGDRDVASMGLNLEEQKAVDRFRREIVEPSMTSLVVLDFWAEWCGPCKALTPVLEKVCGEYADKGVILAKVNVDEEQFIAAQFQVRSIPTVYAMFQGQPVADLTSARTESQLKAMLDQLLSQLPLGGQEPEPEVAQFVEMGESVLAEGDGERAAGIFAQVVEMAPENPAARAGLIRALLAAGRTDEARAASGGLDEAVASDPAVKAAIAAVELAGERVDEGELQALRAAAAERPTDMDAQLAFAEAAFAAGERDSAADTLLAMIEHDREWNDGAARSRLLKIFEATGLEDPWVVATRRRLSRVLFG
jgi:putative thioredoxin